MAWLRAFGCHLPARVVANDEVAALVGVDPAWIVQMSGIRERRYAAAGETTASLGAQAARNCLERAGMAASEIGLVLVSCGSAERRFPGPASAIGAALGIPGIPCVDLPLASAGSLFAIAMADGLAASYRNVLVVGTEIMSRAVRLEPAARDTAMLFGDGAGACLVSAEGGFGQIAGSLLASDGSFAEALRMDLDAPFYMDGRTIILQASRKIPRAILDLLERNQLKPDQVGMYVMHQANLNLIERVAKGVGVPAAKFFANIERYGNTSSASLLIAAAEWWQGGALDSPLVLAAFGAGLNWGALLLR